MSIFESEFISKICLAWQKQLDISQLIDFAGKLNDGGEYTLESILYQTWLERNDTPLNHIAYFNLGTASYSIFAILIAQSKLIFTQLNYRPILFSLTLILVSSMSVLNRRIWL